MTATEIVQKLEEAIKRVTSSSEELSNAQDKVRELSAKNQEVVTEVSTLRAELDKALNEQLSAVGVDTSGRVRSSR